MCPEYYIPSGSSDKGEMSYDHQQNIKRNQPYHRSGGSPGQTTAPQLEAEVKNSLSDVKHLTFDFSRLDYISSAGLRVLLSAQKVMNKQGNMRITNVNETIMEVFDVTGFVDILTIE